MAIADAMRVERDADRFSVAGYAAPDDVIVRGRRVAAGIAGYGAGHAIDMLEHALHPPEASSGEHGCLTRRSGIGFVARWWRDSRGRFGIGARYQGGGRDRQQRGTRQDRDQAARDQAARDQAAHDESAIALRTSTT